MVTCYVCNKEFKTRRQLSGHVKKLHGLSYIDYMVRYEGFKIPICFCGRHRRYRNMSLKFDVTCGDMECKRKRRISTYKEETREKMRKIRFEYLKKQLGETAWERRRSGKMSYLEKWFYDHVILKHSLLEKYDIVNEYPEYPYFIDFAFINSKIAVELDGMQHFRNEKNQLRDIKKQKYLESVGWKVYRIKFDEITESKIKECLDILSNPGILEPKILEPTLFRMSSYRKTKGKKREEYYTLLREKIRDSEKDNIEKIKNSNIDFSVFGWVTKAAKLIGKHPQKINGWIKKYCPDILDKAFKKTSRDSIPPVYPKPYLFSKLEEKAYRKGYRMVGNSITNKAGKILIPHFVGEYLSVNIVIGDSVKHLKLHRFKAYLLYGDSIYVNRSKVIFKNGNKCDLSDNNISVVPATVASI